jgi:hypothetical protein
LRPPSKVTSYDLIGLPPSEVGGTYRRVNCPDAGPAITLVMDGGPGNVADGAAGAGVAGTEGAGVVGAVGEGDGDGLVAACAGVDASRSEASRLEAASTRGRVRRTVGTTQG